VKKSEKRRYADAVAKKTGSRARHPRRITAKTVEQPKAAKVANSPRVPKPFDANSPVMRKLQRDLNDIALKLRLKAIRVEMGTTRFKAIIAKVPAAYAPNAYEMLARAVQSCGLPIQAVPLMEPLILPPRKEKEKFTGLGMRPTPKGRGNVVVATSRREESSFEADILSTDVMPRKPGRFIQGGLPTLGKNRKH